MSDVKIVAAGDGKTAEPGTAVAKATLSYDVRIGAFALADPEFPTDGEQADAEDGEHR